MVKKILLGLFLIFLLAQFIRPSLNTGEAHGPEDITQVVPVPDSIHKLLVIACYDCHSNKTNYPWYNMITPVNWWLNDHVEEGKKHLNFSIFSKYKFRQQEHKLEEIIETVKRHSMPLDSYLWVHKEAKLSDEQRIAIVAWANLTRQQLLSNEPGGSLQKNVP